MCELEISKWDNPAVKEVCMNYSGEFAVFVPGLGWGRFSHFCDGIPNSFIPGKDGDVLDAAGKSLVDLEIKVGYQDCKKPTHFLRYGIPPKNGRSFNFRDQIQEKGISCFVGVFEKGKWELVGEGRSPWFSSRPLFVSPYDPSKVVGIGSDGEPLVNQDVKWKNS